ncbi:MULTISPECIES: hypothetical protein [unclassified Streptomyces]|nr:hypothetical protein OG457_24160 [Streptomyces sp. NBC_01207]WTA19958.1 hypothetical protein OG365_18870 [Streptomyces sp. NBC_00853]
MVGDATRTGLLGHRIYRYGEAHGALGPAPGEQPLAEAFPGLP